MALDPATQAQVVIAAAIIAGPQGSDSDVKRHTERIATYLIDGSLPMSAFAAAEQKAQNTSQLKSFPATIIGIDKENTSTRAVLFLRTKPSEHHPNGQETVRTERTDSDAGRNDALTLQSLIGHKVFIHVAVERTGTNNVRVIRSWEDKGVDPNYNPADPAWQFDYSALPTQQRRKLATQQQQPVQMQQAPVPMPLQQTPVPIPMPQYG